MTPYLLSILQDEMERRRRQEQERFKAMSRVPEQQEMPLWVQEYLKMIYSGNKPQQDSFSFEDITGPQSESTIQRRSSPMHPYNMPNEYYKPNQQDRRQGQPTRTIGIRG